MDEGFFKEFRFEIILAIGGIMTLASFFLPWAGWEESVLFGYSKTPGTFAFIGSWLIIIAAMISYDLFRSQFLNDLKPYSDAGIGMIGGGLAIVAIVAFQMSTIASLNTGNTNYSPDVGFYLTLVGGILAIFACIIMAWQEASERGPRRDREKPSGGL